MSNEQLAKLALKFVSDGDGDLEKISELTGIPVDVLRAVRDNNKEAADMIGLSMDVPSKAKMQDSQTGYDPTEFGVSDWDNDKWTI